MLDGVYRPLTDFRVLLADHTVYLLPYRGYGKSGGSPQESDLYTDALAVFDAVQLKHDRVSLLGRSLGSGVATYVAAHRRVDKLVLVTPFDSIERVASSVYWMFPVSWLLRDKYGSIDRVDQIAAETTVLIAERDRVIPRASSDRLVDRFGDQLANVQVIAGADHNTISAYREYELALRRALD